MKAVEKALQFPEQFDELDPYVDVSYEEEQIPARLKINKKRGTSNIATSETVEILDAA